ncbi:MAG: hypothetical protein H0W67_05250 [Gemmatimonadales bacterium]|nr:hypothetical protein [Gemmatimonadales bacterium]
MSVPALRPLSVGEILDVAFGVYRLHFATLAIIVAVCSAVPFALGLYVQAAGGLFRTPLLSVVYYLSFVVMQTIATAGTVFVVSEGYLGRPLGPWDALRRATPLVGRLLVTSLSLSFVVIVGLFLFFVPGIVALCGLIFATPALVLEPGLSPTEALGRSWTLTRGARRRVFGLLITAGILIYIPLIALGGIAALFLPSSEAGLASSGALIVTLAVTGVLQMFLLPFFHCMLTVAYYDLRVRREGFDLEVLASTLQSA